MRRHSEYLTDNGPPCRHCGGTCYGYELGTDRFHVSCWGCHAVDVVDSRLAPSAELTAADLSAEHRRDAMLRYGPWTLSPESKGVNHADRT